MKTKIQKTLKPVDFDIHLKYLCPSCGQTHWLSFLETSTKHFKVVCDCGLVFGIKRTKDFKVSYVKKQQQNKNFVSDIKPDREEGISKDLLDRAVSTLMVYGFTKKESEELVLNNYTSDIGNDFNLLIKKSLASLRGK